MPLRDHFRPPLDDRHRWEGLHGGWPMMIVAHLRHKLPPGYLALPHVHPGTSVEIDVATFEDEGRQAAPVGEGAANGGVATAVWAPPRPTVVAATDLPSQAAYEVRVYNERRHSRLVAAVEIVSPTNKDRPEHRRLFVNKCAALLREQVCVVIVDVVTTRTQNLDEELLGLIDLTDPGLVLGTPPMYAAVCRLIPRAGEWLLEGWGQPLALGQPLPTVPLWLADDYAVPLELEASYEQSCEILSIP